MVQPDGTEAGRDSRRDAVLRSGQIDPHRQRLISRGRQGATLCALFTSRDSYVEIRIPDIIRSRPVYGTLEARAGKQHLMIADAEGAEAILIWPRPN